MGFGTEAWQKRLEDGRSLHGLGPSTYLPGNVCHLVSPIVGVLRLLRRDGETPNQDDMDWFIDRLVFVLELAREAGPESAWDEGYRRGSLDANNPFTEKRS